MRQTVEALTASITRGVDRDDARAHILHDQRQDDLQRERDRREAAAIQERTKSVKVQITKTDGTIKRNAKVDPSVGYRRFKRLVIRRPSRSPQALRAGFCS